MIDPLKDSLAQLIVESERIKRLSWMAQAAALPALVSMALNLLGKIVDEIIKLKGVKNG